MKYGFEELKTKGWVFNRKYKRYREDIIEYQINTQKSFSMHNAIVFLAFGFIFTLADCFVWQQFRIGTVLCFGVGFFSLFNFLLYKKVLPRHRDWIIPAGNIYILILGKFLLSVNLVGGGDVSWTLLLCALISTSMIIIIPSYYITIVLIMLGLDMVEFIIMSNSFLDVFYNLLDDMIIGSFCIGINVIFSKVKYAEMERKENLYTESSRDPLTKLYNRRYLESYFEGHTDYSRRCAILILDLDNFKMANDKFGHKKGDEVLCQVAEILRDNFREDDCIARLGGDEFAVFLPEISKKEVVMDRVERVLKRFPIVIEGEIKVEVSVSIGIVFKEAGELPSYTQLSERADGAMYRAKKAGKGQAVIASA
jgi:diguanylate cyclase (GGDEF)-like protein